jgi:hypothetical protein
MNTQADNAPTKLEIEYKEVDIAQVIRYFVNGYKLDEGKITNYEYFIDSSKGKAVLKLFTEKPTGANTGEKE